MTTCALRVDDTAEPAAATLLGELDRTNVAEFVAAVEAVPGTRPFVLDLSELRFVDSAGFAAAIRLIEERVVVLVLHPVSLLRRAATVMGLPLYDRVEDARAALSRPPSPMPPHAG
ncbi:MAG: STAS domain-containing protein [Sporichthyaceae bacterium]